MAHNLTLLDEGTLHVAKLSSDIPANQIDGSGKLPATGSFNGTGTWVALLRSGPGGQAESLVPGVTAQEAAVFTRFAADKAGATKMDRPEDFEANPKTGKVYVALTNNDERGAPGEAAPDAANPRIDNKSGPPTRTSRGSTRRRSTPSPARTATCGSRPTAMRWTPTTGYSPSRSTGPSAARPSSSSPCRSAQRPAGPSSPTT